MLDEEIWIGPESRFNEFGDSERIKIPPRSPKFSESWPFLLGVSMKKESRFPQTEETTKCFSFPPTLFYFPLEYGSSLSRAKQ